MQKFGKKKLKSLLYVTVGGYCTYAAISLYKGEETFYRNFIMPVLHMLDPETAHNLAVSISEKRLPFFRSHYKNPDILRVKVFGREFPNPVGIAAGFDKNAKAVLGLTDLGFGFIEVGSVTPQPQPGNEKPRVFRLMNDKAVINRYGFNSDGHAAVLKRIQDLKLDQDEICILGVNLGKNKTSTDPVSDYVQGIQTFGPVADYLVINVSSPNTPGLRNLQGKEDLRLLLKSLVEARDNLPLKKKPPLLLKLAPDLSYEERKDIAEVVKTKECKVDGLIVCNTTIERPDSLESKERVETGGLSGEPLKDVSTQMISDMYKLTNGMPIIGVGGISTGQDAYDKIKAGAVLVQLYTSLIYEGPPIVTKVKRELVQLLTRDGYDNVKSAVGSGNSL